MSTTLDISPFLEAKSDQITADDLIGGPRSFRVARVEVPGGEQPVSVHMEGYEGKPFKPCKGMRRLLAQLWGPDAATWVGRSVTLFRDPDVRFGADQTGGVRVAAVSHLDETKTVPVRVSRGKAKQYKVEPLRTETVQDDGLEVAIDKIIATIARAPNEAKLDAYLAGKPAAAINAARENVPELAARLDKAIAAKRAEFGSDDDPFGEQEGGAGQEEADEAPPPDWIARIDECTTLKQLDKLEAEFDKVSASLPDRVEANTRQQFDLMRKALKGK